MHVSESLDPVVNRLLENLPYLDLWLADMTDAIHLLDTLSDYLHNPEHQASGDRLLALLRSALTDLSGGVDELSCILNLSEHSKLSPIKETVPELKKLICGCGCGRGLWVVGCGCGLWANPQNTAVNTHRTQR